MGMRVITAIGYGLNIAGMDKTTLRGRWDNEKQFDLKTDEIIQMVNDTKDEDHDGIMMQDRMFFGDKRAAKFKFNFTECYDYDDEFFDEDYLMLYPHPFGSDWRRYDDSIDYFQSFLLQEQFGEPTDTVWKQSRMSLYPYSGLMRKDPTKFLGVDYYSEPFYTMDSEKMKDAIPHAPLHLMFYIKVLNLVPEDQLLDAFMQLRPTYARWWS